MTREWPVIQVDVDLTGWTFSIPGTRKRVFVSREAGEGEDYRVRFNVLQLEALEKLLGGRLPPPP